MLVHLTLYIYTSLIDKIEYFTETVNSNHQLCNQSLN
jgi:hypothetical protein